jgi:hypothetical protein
MPQSDVAYRMKDQAPLGLVLDLRHLIRPGYKSVAGKLCPIRAVKTGLGEYPKKRGFPEN